MTNSHSTFQKHSKKLIFSLLFILVLSQNISTSIAQEDNGDDGKGGGREFGWVSLGLFGTSFLYVFFYKSFIISRKYFPKRGLLGWQREFIRKIFLKVRKPLLILHYFAGVVASIILFIHGIPLMNFESGTVIIGWITAYAYLFYIVSGIIIKFVLKDTSKARKIKRILYQVHKNLIILVIIGLVHIAHLAMID